MNISNKKYGIKYITAFRFSNEVIKTIIKIIFDAFFKILNFHRSKINIAKTIIASCPKGHILDS